MKGEFFNIEFFFFTKKGANFAKTFVKRAIVYIKTGINVGRLFFKRPPPSSNRVVYMMMLCKS